MNDEKPIVLRPRRPKQQGQDESKTWAKAFRSLIHVVRMTSSRPSSMSSSKGSRGRRHLGQSSYRQRCAVRITYSGNRVKGQWAAHGRYIMRDGATQLAENGLGCGFAAHGDIVDPPARLRSWQSAGDPRMFKLIVSPEFGERVDLTRLVRDLLRRMENDLGRSLEWVAVSHFNTEHPHAHVVLRGVADGQELRLDREYVKHSVRKHAEEACTEQLGFRTRTDALIAEEKEAEQMRLTSLDRQIARSRSTNADRTFRVDINPAVRPSMARRLLTLEKLGLAERGGESKWSVRADFDAVLRTMQTVTDRQRMVAAHAELLSDPRLPIQYTPTKHISDLSGRVIDHRYDDSSSRPLMILEGTDSCVHIVPHDGTIERERARGLMASGHFISIKQTERGLSIVDHGDAEQHVRSLRVSKNATRTADSNPVFGGWLGRYQSVLDSASLSSSRLPTPRRASPTKTKESAKTSESSRQL